MSTEDPNVPKRRSSSAKRRRRSRTRVTIEGGQTTVQHVSETKIQAEPNQATIDRNIQRREERRAAKAQSEKKGIAKVVDTERFSGARKFYEDTMSEIRKVIWPDRKQTLNLTLLVIALSVIMGSLLGGIDWVMLKLFETIG